MPYIGLRGMKVGKYVNTKGTDSYTDVTEVGDAISANMELTIAEGVLWAEDGRAEVMRKATGGNVTIGVKYIKDPAKKLMYGVEEKTRTVSNNQVKSLVTTAKQQGNYVGLGCYAPDVIDGVEKFTAFFVKKAKFSQPSVSLQTADDSITFGTPSTTGTFLPDDSTDRAIMEAVTVDTEAAAVAWIAAVLV